MVRPVMVRDQNINDDSNEMAEEQEDVLGNLMPRPARLPSVLRTETSQTQSAGSETDATAPLRPVLPRRFGYSQFSGGPSNASDPDNQGDAPPTTVALPIGLRTLPPSPNDQARQAWATRPPIRMPQRPRPGVGHDEGQLRSPVTRARTEQNRFDAAEQIGALRAENMRQQEVVDQQFATIGQMHDNQGLAERYVENLEQRLNNSQEARLLALRTQRADMERQFNDREVAIRENLAREYQTRSTAGSTTTRRNESDGNGPSTSTAGNDGVRHGTTSGQSPEARMATSHHGPATPATPAESTSVDQMLMHSPPVPGLGPPIQPNRMFRRTTITGTPPTVRFALSNQVPSSEADPDPEEDREDAQDVEGDMDDNLLLGFGPELLDHAQPGRNRRGTNSRGILSDGRRMSPTEQLDPRPTPNQYHRIIDAETALTEVSTGIASAQRMNEALVEELDLTRGQLVSEQARSSHHNSASTSVQSGGGRTQGQYLASTSVQSGGGQIPASTSVQPGGGRQNQIMQSTTGLIGPNHPCLAGGIERTVQMDRMADHVISNLREANNAMHVPRNLMENHRAVNDAINQQPHEYPPVRPSVLTQRGPTRGPRVTEPVPRYPWDPNFDPEQDITRIADIDQITATQGLAPQPDQSERVPQSSNLGGEGSVCPWTQPPNYQYLGPSSPPYYQEAQGPNGTEHGSQGYPTGRGPAAPSGSVPLTQFSRMPSYRIPADPLNPNGVQPLADINAAADQLRQNANVFQRIPQISELDRGPKVTPKCKDYTTAQDIEQWFVQFEVYLCMIRCRTEYDRVTNLHYYMANHNYAFLQTLSPQVKNNYPRFKAALLRRFRERRDESDKLRRAMEIKQSLNNDETVDTYYERYEHALAKALPKQDIATSRVWITTFETNLRPDIYAKYRDRASGTKIETLEQAKDLAVDCEQLLSSESYKRGLSMQSRQAYRSVAGPSIVQPTKVNQPSLLTDNARLLPQRPRDGRTGQFRRRAPGLPPRRPPYTGVRVATTPTTTTETSTGQQFTRPPIRPVNVPYSSLTPSFRLFTAGGVPKPMHNGATVPLNDQLWLRWVKDHKPNPDKAGVAKALEAALVRYNQANGITAPSTEQVNIIEYEDADYGEEEHTEWVNSEPNDGYYENGMEPQESDLVYDDLQVIDDEEENQDFRYPPDFEC